MKKKPLNLLVDEELVKKARDHGLNLSRFFENQLKGYFDYIGGRHQSFYHSIESNQSEVSKEKESKCGYRDLNPSKWLGNPNHLDFIGGKTAAGGYIFPCLIFVITLSLQALLLMG